MTAEHESAPDDPLARGEGLAASAWSALLLDAPFAVVMYEGPQHRVVFSNRRHDELTMGRVVVGKTLAEALPELVGQPLAATLDRVYATGIAESVRETPTQLVVDGIARQGWLDVTWQPVRNRAGRVVGVLATAIDVSEHVQARHGLEATRAELRRALEVRDEFLSIASHELRTPLTALQLQLQAALRWVERAGAVGEAGLGRKLQIARRQTERLATLVDGLLDVSRISLGRLALEPEPLDLAAVVRAVVERHTAQAQAAGCSLALEAGEAVAGQWDRSRMEQVVANLVTNAIKYGRSEAPIEVSVAAHDGAALLAVRDHGRGVAPRDRARIFAPYERADEAQAHKSLGLGLAIVREIASAHRGSVRLESPADGGSRFVVELPLVDAGPDDGPT